MGFTEVELGSPVRVFSAVDLHMFGVLLRSQTESVAHSLPRLEPGPHQKGPHGVELHADVSLVPVHVPHEPGVLLNPGVDVLVAGPAHRQLLHQAEAGGEADHGGGGGGAGQQHGGWPGWQGGRDALGATLGQQRDTVLVHVLTAHHTLVSLVVQALQ